MRRPRAAHRCCRCIRVTTPKAATQKAIQDQVIGPRRSSRSSRPNQEYKGEDWA